MKLISCDECGVVLDEDKLTFEDHCKDEFTGEIIDNRAEWDGKRLVLTVDCPVCEDGTIRETNK